MLQAILRREEKPQFNISLDMLLISSSEYWGNRKEFKQRGYKLGGYYTELGLTIFKREQSCDLTK